MNHDQQDSKSTGGVPSLPSVLAPLAGYRYAKSVGDRETMLTEAMKFKAKLNDERIRSTEKHNKEVKGLQSKLGEAETNLAIAKGTHKAETDVYKRGYTALQSHLNRVTAKLIDLGIDAKIAEGVGGKITQGALAWEQETGRKFEDQPDEVQNRLIRAFTDQSLMESKSIIAEEAIVSGRAKPGAEEVSNIAGGGRPTRLTDAKAIIAEKGIEEGYEPTDKDMENIAGGGRPSISRSGTGKNLTTGEMNDIAKNVGNQIVASIWSPERTDVPRWFDATSGESPSSDEMRQLTEDLMNELGRTQTLPNDMRTRIDGLENAARAELKQLQANYPDMALFDESDNGRIVFHRNVIPEDKAKARRYMPIKTYFDSPEGQAFKNWLTKSASAGHYMHIARPAAASGRQPAQGDSGQSLTPTGGQRPAITSPRITTAPAPKPKPTGWRGVSKGAGNPDAMIPEDSEIENTITGKLGAGRKDWVQWQGDTYRVLEFWTTDNPKVPFMVKLRKYAKEYRRGKMRNKASYEWLYPKQLGGLQKINMPDDIRAMIENNQMP